MRQFLKFATLTLTALGAAACGGGGGSGPTTTPPPTTTPTTPPPPPVVNYDTSEYRRHFGLETINSIPAYEAGLSGDGVAVAVIDTGIDLTHPDLDGNISPLSIDIRSNTYDQVQDEYGHGTWVSGVIAAEKNDVGTHGVAFNAQIMAVRTDDHEGCDDGCTFYNTDIADGINYAVASGASVINLSLGSDTPVFPSSTLGQAITNAVNAGVLVVIAAGNGDDNDIGQPSPTAFSSYAAEPAVKGGIIITGAVDQNGTIASFSNRAGTGGTQDVYVVAPGDDIITTDLKEDVDLTSPLARVHGTSVAAPHVSGAAAILFELFPDLTGREVAEILFESAADLGAAGDDEVYGQGLIDVGAAIQPLGTLSLQSADGAGMEVNGSLIASPAMGGGMEAALAQGLAFDKYDRAYFAGLDARVHAPVSRFNLGAEAQSLLRRGTNLTLGQSGLQLGISTSDRERVYAVTSLEMQARDRDGRPEVNLSGNLTPDLSLNLRSGSASSFAATPLALSGRAADPASQLASEGARGSLAYALTPGTTLGMAAFSGEQPGIDGDEPLSQSGAAVTFGHALAQGIALTAELGRMHEEGSVLGLTGDGVFDAFDTANTDYITLGGTATYGSLTLNASYMMARTEANLSARGVFANMSALESNAWSLTLTDDRFARTGHRFGLHLTRPLAVTSGSADLYLGTGKSNGDAQYGIRRADLSVEARETSLEFFHSYQTTDSWRLRSNFIYRQNPDNVADRGDEAAFLLYLATSL